jgi:ribosome-associated protein
MFNHTFTLKSEYIELNKLLKIFGVWDSGADAKHMISDWLVTVNGEVELRIRNKLTDGAVVVCESEGVTITVTA